MPEVTQSEGAPEPPATASAPASAREGGRAPAARGVDAGATRARAVVADAPGLRCDSLAAALARAVHERAVAAPMTPPPATAARLPLGRRQLSRTMDDGHDLASNRFASIAALEAAYDGEGAIRPGARGDHVTRLQQALLDAGFALPAHGVDGRFGAETAAAVLAFQRSKGLTGRAADGIVGPQTMGLLDAHFVGHAPERAIAADPVRTLMAGTRALSSSDRAAVTSAITTETRTASGALPTFQRTIAASTDPYEVRIARRLNAAITGLHRALVGSRPPRTPGNLMAQADIDRVARAAKAATDAVYGRYRTGPALAWGTTIFDQFEQRARTIAASTANADAAANWRVMKLLDGDDEIRRIDTEHGAVQSRAPEWSLIAGVTGFPNQSPTQLDYAANPPHVTTGIVGRRRAELLAIHSNWPASAGGGRIYLQRTLDYGNEANRDLMYELFGTIIHEYVHTLEHATHVTYRRSLPEQRGGFVLREGMTDYLAKVVWDNVSFSAALRREIEGRFQDPANPNGHSIPTPDRYSEWIRAERMVGVVGIRNAMAAYFLGRTDLIGAP